MKEQVNIGVIGLGGRGRGLLNTLLGLKNIHVLALCDLFEDRLQMGIEIVEKVTGKTPYSTENYKDILAMPEIDAIIIPASWADHVHIAVDSMKAGKYVGFEVGGAYSIDECWELV